MQNPVNRPPYIHHGDCSAIFTMVTVALPVKAWWSAPCKSLVERCINQRTAQHFVYRFGKFRCRRRSFCVVWMLMTEGFMKQTISPLMLTGSTKFSHGASTKL